MRMREMRVLGLDRICGQVRTEQKGGAKCACELGGEEGGDVKGPNAGEGGGEGAGDGDGWVGEGGRGSKPVGRGDMRSDRVGHCRRASAGAALDDGEQAEGG